MLASCEIYQDGVELTPVLLLADAVKQECRQQKKPHTHDANDQNRLLPFSSSKPSSESPQ